MYVLSRILVPVDFSPCARAALEYAAFLGKHFGATIDVLHVWQPPPLVADPFYGGVARAHTLAAFEDSEAGREMKAFLSHLDEHDRLLVHGRLENGDPYKTILRVALEDAYDIVVMGTHGRTGISHLLLGSLAEAVVRRAPCPVLTIHSGEPQRRASKRSRPNSLAWDEPEGVDGEVQ